MAKPKRFSNTPGELEIIDFIRQEFSGKNKEILKGMGDDGMVLRNGYVLSQDSFFEGVHFDRAYFSMYEVGGHTMAASLSDLAAMAARPVCALVSLNLTKNITIKDIAALYKGFHKIGHKFDLVIGGGDVVQSPGFGLTITVVGRTNRPLFRSTARPGQMLCVTNFLGLAEVGLRVLKEGLPRKDFTESIKKHLFPEPRITQALNLTKYARAGIDTSDGLSTDAYHLAEESRVKIVIDADHVPIHSEVGEYCKMKGIDAMDFILAAGEDFELLFTAQYLPKLPGIKIFRIGRVLPGQGLFVACKGQARRIKPTGYQHLKNH